MKKAVRVVIEMLLLSVLGIFVCLGIFYYVDYIENGVFLEWFERYYIRVVVQYAAEDGVQIIQYKPYWYEIKRLLLKLMCAAVIVWIWSLYIVSHRYAAKKLRKTKEMQSEWELRIREKEQEQKEETKRKNDLIAYLAHDLKTPLASVIGYLSLLSETPDIPREQRERFIRIALEKALRLGNLINEFFEITRYNLQQIKLEKEKTDISYMLVQITDEFYPILREHGNTVQLITPESLMAVVDGEKLARVFGNILKNAVAYSYENTEIIITAERNGQNLSVSLENCGVTIPKERLEMIFEKFYRLDENRSSNTGGSGLGLAIAKEIVLMHKGTLKAQSEGEKTIFTVCIPLA